MASFKIDIASSSYKINGAVREVNEFVEGAAAGTARSQLLVDGVPQYAVELAIFTPGEAIDTAVVKFTSAKVPAFTLGADVKLTGLVATPYKNNAGNVAISYRAASIEAAK